MKQSKQKPIGRDEMNFAEFPIALLSERAPRGVTTLEFELDEWDSAIKQRVKRRVTVEGSAKHGLPTAKDEEVLLGLIQLSKRTNDFKSPVVNFTQRSLLEEIGWTAEGRSYTRLRKAFNRLQGVTLYYKNAWKDNTDKRYVTTGGFGVLSRFEIGDARNAGKTQHGRELDSVFEWSSVIQKSFESGYLKNLDYGLVKSFQYAATKRLYRFLDKHFYPEVGNTKLTYDLETLAYQHLGVTRRKDASAIKNAIEPAIIELEEAGYIYTLSKDERFQKSGKSWRVAFCLNHRHGVKRAHARTSRTKASESKAKKEAPRTQHLDTLMLAEKGERESVVEAALKYCDRNHPKKSEGYRRNRGRKSKVCKEYLELVLDAYFTSA